MSLTRCGRTLGRELMPNRAVRSSRLFLVAAPLVLGLSVQTVFAQSTDAEGFSFRYFKESRPLTLDPTRIAVFNAVAGRAISSIPGIGAPESEQLPLDGIVIHSVTPDARTEQAVRSAIQSASLARADAAPDFISPVFIGSDGGPVIITQTLLIGFEPATTPERRREILASVNAGHVLDEDYANTRGLLRVESASRSGIETLEIANKLAQNPEVRYAEPNWIFTGHSNAAPNDPYYSTQWALRNSGNLFGSVAGQDMQAERAWLITTGDPDIIDVIIDVGVDPSHPDLNQIVPGIDTTTNAGNGQPFNGCDKHGTAVAGCVSAIANNGIGVAGLAPTARTVSARTFISSLNCSGSWTSNATWTVNTLAFAESIGARVTNNSNGYGFTSSAIADKYASTRASGMVHFASAGNSGSSTIGYPASLPSVNAIAALNVNGVRAGFSQYGVGLDFSAPGVSVASTDIQGNGGYNTSSSAGDYVYVDGTSFASPLSSAVATLILSYDPSLSAAQVERAMQQGARDQLAPGYDTGSGWGFVDAYRSLERVRCPADLTFDDIVEDGDFSLFAVSYNLFLCEDSSMPLACSADLNGDNVVDDADFSLFVVAYDILLCPSND